MRLSGFQNFCGYIESWWVFERFLDLAQFRRTDERRMILRREGGRHLNFKIDLVHQAVHRVGIIALNNANAIGG